MPVVLIATPGSPFANSFTTLAEADAWLLGQLYSDVDWEEADEDQKNRALITATREIIRNVASWAGWPTSIGQALPFPRSGVYSALGNSAYPSGEIPLELKAATAEYARQLLNLKRMPDTPVETAGLKKLTAGPVSLEFDNAYRHPTGLPASVLSMIRHLIEGRTFGIPVHRT